MDEQAKSFIRSEYEKLYETLAEVKKIPNPQTIVLGQEQKTIVHAYTALLRYERGMPTRLSELNQAAGPRFYGVPSEYSEAKDAIHIVFMPEKPGPHFMKSL
tara:strand:- start:115 stop:420 length:306 start_codon:yes stop_codon:yes gene_type:complete